LKRCETPKGAQENPIFRKPWGKNGKDCVMKISLEVGSFHLAQLKRLQTMGSTLEKI